jgi:hypothetical protein
MTWGNGASLACPVPFDSRSVLLDLQTLECQLAKVPRHLEALHLAWARPDPGGVLRATALAECHIRTMALTAGRLKAQVVAADDLGETVESLSELGLRAARMVVLAELPTLRELACPVPGHGPSPGLSWGRFRGIDDLTVCVHDELNSITTEWRTGRSRARSDRPAFRAGLRAAYALMRKLGTASEFARFLWDGRHRADWPALQALCGRASLALTMRLDVEPEMPLMIHVKPAKDRAAERAS